MSYILDALKKSERERSGVRAGEAAADGGDTRARNPWPLVVTLVLVSNALLGLGWWAWQRATDAPHAADTSPPAAPATVNTDPMPPAPPVVAAQSTPQAKTPVGDLAAEARAATPTPSPRTVVPKRTYIPGTAAATISPPAPAPEDTGVQPTAAHPPAAAAIPWLRELPASFRSAVAPLNVNIHVYAGSSADSVLYINDHQYRAGESLPNGVRLDAVVADGAVLSYQGQQFKLPRPN